MTTHEIIPDIRANKQFPMGDIIDPYKDKKIDEWFCRVQEMDFNAYQAMVKAYHKPMPYESKTARKTHDAAEELCREWDNANDPDKPLTQVGYRLAAAFNRKNNFLPPLNVDLSPQLEQMKNDQKHLVREFGRIAWEGMQQHKNIHRTFTELLEIGKSKFDLYPDDHSEYFQAGMALPYLFALTSRLEGYTPKFTSMLSTVMPPDDLDIMAFHRLFTTGARLAHEDRSKR